LENLPSPAGEINPAETERGRNNACNNADPVKYFCQIPLSTTRNARLKVRNYIDKHQQLGLTITRKETASAHKTRYTQNKAETIARSNARLTDFSETLLTSPATSLSFPFSQTSRVRAHHAEVTLKNQTISLPLLKSEAARNKLKRAWRSRS